MTARRLWLVRHGETAGQSRIRYHGRNDVPLSDEGRAQIRALAPWLQGVAFRRVVHSPLSRAAESAAILAAECGLPGHVLHADERLREISFGDCEGMTRDEIDAAFPGFWGAWHAGTTEAFPGGEARSVFAARVAAAFADLTAELAATPGQADLLVVAHRGIVRHGLAAVLGLEGAEPAAFGVDLGSLTVLRHAGPGWAIERLGARP